MSEICGITPGRVDVAAEDLAVQAERDDTLLDPRPAGVVEPDDRAADLHREVHDLDDLLAEHLTERAAEDGEVLREHRHGAPVDRAVAGDDPVAVGAVLVLAEGDRAVAGVLVHLDERALVEEHLEPLPGGLLAAGVLLLDRALGPALATSATRRLRSASFPAVVVVSMSFGTSVPPMEWVSLLGMLRA